MESWSLRVRGAWKPCWAQTEAEATLCTTSPAWSPEDGGGGVGWGCRGGSAGGWSVGIGEAHRNGCWGCCEGLRSLPKEGM